MILIDANLLVYACVRDMPQHERARAWLDGVLGSEPRVGLPWPSLLAFVRLTVNPRVFKRPLQVDQAWQRVTDWLAQPQVWVPQPTEAHAVVLGRLLSGCAQRANLVPDAHLAALAVEHGLVLCSADSDFARFSSLRWQNPIGSP